MLIQLIIFLNITIYNYSIKFVCVNDSFFFVLTFYNTNIGDFIKINFNLKVLKNIRSLRSFFFYRVFKDMYVMSKPRFLFYSFFIWFNFILQLSLNKQNLLIIIQNPSEKRIQYLDFPLYPLHLYSGMDLASLST